LVVAAQEGGGLVVYNVSALTGGNTQPSGTISLNGASLRALVPNPVAQELFAAVTVTGELLMVNIKEGQVVQGPAGPILKSGVSCVSWSNMGKQLMAGLGDGTGYQMKPSGEGQAQIPRPPDLQGDQHGEFILIFLSILC
jgi:nucleoporin NUP159